MTNAEVRYLDIPGRELAPNGLPEVDEIIVREGLVHLETSNDSDAYMTVPGYRVAIHAYRVKGDPLARLAITVEPESDDE